MTVCASSLILLLASFTVSQEEPPGCFEQGECTRSLVLNDWPASGPQGCLDECQDHTGCQFFTYYEDQELCLGFANCEEFDEGICDGKVCYSGSRGCEDLQCFVEGRCVGVLLDEEVSEDEEECLELCKRTDDCEWFTFDREESACLLLETCTLVPDETCVSGQRPCGEDSEDNGGDDFYTDLTKIVVIGGASDGVSSLDSVEVLDISSKTNCAAEAAIPPYPLAARGSSAVLHPSGRIRVFGGLGGGGEYLAESSEFDPQAGEWSDPVRMGLPRAFAAATVVGDGGEVLISGGETTGGDTLDSTSIWSPSSPSSFSPGPALPFPMSHHCQVRLNSTHVFVSDAGDSLRSYVLDWTEGTWRQVESISRRYGGGACGRINSASRGEEVVVVQDLSEIFSLEAMEWREGPEQGLIHSASGGSAQQEETFVILGGYRGGETGEFWGSLYRFIPGVERWDDLEVELEVPRDQAAVVAVPSNFVDCDG